MLDQLKTELGDRVEELAADLAEAANARRCRSEPGAVDVSSPTRRCPRAGRYEDSAPEEVDRALDVNLRAPIQLARAFAPANGGARLGHLVFISSLSGKAASPRRLALLGDQVRVARLRPGPARGPGRHRVGVTTVFPGFIRDAGMFAESGHRAAPSVGTRTPQDQVAEGVVSGIERDKPEVDVAPLSLRLGSIAAGIALAPWAPPQRRLGSPEVAARIGQGPGGQALSGAKPAHPAFLGCSCADRTRRTPASRGLLGFRAAQPCELCDRTSHSAAQPFTGASVLRPQQRRIRVTSAERGTQSVPGANREIFARRASSFSASPTANPAGGRER